MIDWIIENCEWIFGGVGATIIGCILTALLGKKEKSHTKPEKIEIHQTNTGSHGTQIGIQQNYYSGGKEDDR